MQPSPDESRGRAPMRVGTGRRTLRVRREVAVERGDKLQKGPHVAETFPVHVEDSYVIVEV